MHISKKVVHMQPHAHVRMYVHTTHMHTQTHTPFSCHQLTCNLPGSSDCSLHFRSHFTLLLHWPQLITDLVSSLSTSGRTHVCVCVCGVCVCGVCVWCVCVCVCVCVVCVCVPLCVCVWCVCVCVVCVWCGVCGVCGCAHTTPNTPLT